MLNSQLKYLKDEIDVLEQQVIKKIESYLENLDIELNIIETKKSEKTKNGFLQGYKVHFLNKCLTIDDEYGKILYRDESISNSDIELSKDYYLKLSVNIKKRLSLIQMQKKLEDLKNLLIVDSNKS